MDVSNEKSGDAGLDISISVAQLNQEWEQYIREEQLRNELKALEAEASDDASPDDLDDEPRHVVDTNVANSINITGDSGIGCESKSFSNKENDHRLCNVKTDEKETKHAEITTERKVKVNLMHDFDNVGLKTHLREDVLTNNKKDYTRGSGEDLVERKSSKLADIIKKTKQGGGASLQGLYKGDAGFWSQNGKSVESGERLGRTLKRDGMQTKSVTDNNRKLLISGGNENKKSSSLAAESSKDVVDKENKSLNDENSKLSYSGKASNENRTKSANNKKLLIFGDEETKNSPSLVTESSKDVVGKGNKLLNDENNKLTHSGRTNNESQTKSADNKKLLLFGGKETKKSPCLVGESSKDLVGKENKSLNDENNKLSLSEKTSNENQTKSANNKKLLIFEDKETKNSPSLLMESSKDVAGKGNKSSNDENNKLTHSGKTSNENQTKSANNKKLLIFGDRETKKSPSLVTESSKIVMGTENKSSNDENNKCSFSGKMRNENPTKSAPNSSTLITQGHKSVENTQNGMFNDKVDKSLHTEAGGSGNPLVLPSADAKQTNFTTPASKMAQNIRSTQKTHRSLHAEQGNQQTPSMPKQNPGRSQEVSKAQGPSQFITPCRPLPPGKVAQSLPTKQPAEEASAQKPRIMCTIDMRSHLNTPIFQIPAKKPSVRKHLLSTSTLDCVLEDDASAEREEKEQCLSERKVGDVFECVTVKGVEYIVLNALGKGGSSVVYHCYDPKSREERAVKVVDLKKDKNDAIGFINEVKALRRLQDCDHIIKLYDSEIRNDDNKLFMVLEKGGRDFAQILREHKRNSAHLPAFMVHYYWMQMLHAVRQMHSKGVIHSDLKPANFIEIRERLKLIDFGISSCVQTDATSVMKTVSLGTFGYISPEALCADRGGGASPGQPTPTFKVGYKSDVWSLGCILYQLVYKCTPFAHIQHSAAQFAAVMDPNHAIRYPQADWVPVGIVRCMRACLQHNARKRPSVDELIQAGGCIDRM